MRAGVGKRISIFVLIMLTLASCGWAPRTKEYREYYAHLKSKPGPSTFCRSEYFLVIYVSARHLDYFSSQSFLRTLVKHPSDGSLNGDVGHAWISLNGPGELIEGGHSGELGIDQPRYFDGVMDLVEQGDPNPIRYMHQVLTDGFFQQGSGGHPPTFAIKVDLSEEQYLAIKDFIGNYNFREFSLTHRQCVSFAASAASYAGLNLETEATIPVDRCVRVGKEVIVLWQDPKNSTLTIHSPDVLEKSMMRAAQEGRAEVWPCHCDESSCSRWIPWPSRCLRVFKFH